MTDRSHNPLLALLVLLAATVPATACKVPVFRFALDNWPSSPLELTVLLERPLDAEQRRWVADLTRRTTDGSGGLNLVVQTLDRDGVIPADREVLFRSQEGRPLPRATLRLPDPGKNDPPAWSGPLTADTLAALSDSPTRRELAKRLLAGDAVVWLFLESGDKDADAKAHTLLVETLAKLEKTIELPELGPDDEKFLRSDVELRVGFSTLRVSRTDPAEAVLVALLLTVRPDEIPPAVAMLAGSGAALAMPAHPDLPPLNGPVAFPVLGRGLVVTGVGGTDLTAREITSLSRFLCGACSCRVKDQLGGYDLPLDVDWDTKLFSLPPGTRPKVAAPALPPEPLRTLGTERRPRRAAEEPDEPAGWLVRGILFSGAGVVAVVVVGAVILALRGGRP